MFKFIYACRLAETGLCAQAFHYCEVISRAVLSMPSYHSPVFISQLIQVIGIHTHYTICFTFRLCLVLKHILLFFLFQMSERLRFFDPQLKEKPEQELFQEPDWLLHLRKLQSQIKVSMCVMECLKRLCEFGE